MAMHPSSGFPLLPSDQADVIRIYLDLMCERYGPGRAVVADDTPIGSLDGPERSQLPREMHDLD